VSPIPNLLHGNDFGTKIQPMHVRSDQARLRIREEMERKRLSQRDLAGLLGSDWTQSRVGKILTGRVKLVLDDLEQLCFAVGISLTEAVRDHGLEFCAEMTPTELRFLERIRQLTPELRDAYLKTMAVHTKTRLESRRAVPEKKIPRGRG
jgi:transcriptional regulator with XRE-family HTH domain